MLRLGSPVVLAAFLAGCALGGPKAGTSSDGGGANPDGGSSTTDAGPISDAPPQVTQMYVHTADTLYVMDDQTFSLTLIGNFGLGTTDQITDLAVTPDDALYGISNTKLYKIDKDTAAATYVADVPGVANVGLTFLKDGTLLATDKAGGVRVVNPMTGAVNEVGSFGGGYATAGDLVAVNDGTMYAISDEGPVGDEYTNNWLLTVNTDTGVATGVGQIGYGGVFGVAYAGGHVYAFTNMGQVIEINRTTGAGSLIKTYPVEFWGAAVTPLVQVN